MAATFFEELGGEPVLRNIIRTFFDRMFSDPMIGFLFRNASRERVADKEYELAGQHLGGGVAYTGRPIRQSHPSHAILGEHLQGLLTIFRRTLEHAGAPSDVIQPWLAYTERLRPV